MIANADNILLNVVKVKHLCSHLSSKKTMFHQIIDYGMPASHDLRQGILNCCSYICDRLPHTHPHQPRWLSGLKRSRVHSLMIARRSSCPEKLGSNPGQGVKGLIYRAGMVLICPLL